MTHRWDPDDALMQAYRDAKREHEANMAALNRICLQDGYDDEDDLLGKAELSLAELEEVSGRIKARPHPGSCPCLNCMRTRAGYRTAHWENKAGESPRVLDGCDCPWCVIERGGSIKATALPASPVAVLAVDTPSSREAERQRAGYEASPQSVIDALAEFDAWMLAGGVWKDEPPAVLAPVPQPVPAPAPRAEPPRKRETPGRTRERRRRIGQVTADCFAIGIGLVLVVLSAHYGWPLSFPGLILLIFAAMPWGKSR